MAELSPDAEATIAAMTEAEVDLLLARTRAPEEEQDPKARAVAALRRHRGLDRTGRATPEQAAAALADFQRHGTD